MLDKWLGGLAIPAERIIFLHVCLKELHRLTGKPYRQLAGEILAALRGFRPEAILVPAYTIHSFMLTGVFHRLFSRSEVGRFSEEVRREFARYRTLDPMYSVLDCGDYLPRQAIDYHRTFGTGSLFAHLAEKDAVIVNIGMDGFWSTMVHGVELERGIDYRREKTFSGVVYRTETHWEKVAYTAFVREMGTDGAQFPPYNRRRRLLYLEQEKILRISEAGGVRAAWAPATEFSSAIARILGENSRFLVD